MRSSGVKAISSSSKDCSHRLSAAGAQTRESGGWEKLMSGKQLSTEFSDMWEVKEVWIRLDLLPFQALAIFKSIAFGTSNTASIVNDTVVGI